MESSQKRVLKLVEQGEWDEMLHLIEQQPALAQVQDDFGMLPLHWACTEPSVKLDVVSTLTRVFPDACKLENLSGMLPLHVAIKTKLPGLLINALLDVYPQAALIKDGNGCYPLDLAFANNLPSFTTDLIRKFADRARKTDLKQRSILTADDITESSSNQSSDEDDIPMLAKSQSMMSSSRSLVEKRSSLADDMHSSTISLQLKELLFQLYKLNTDIRGTSTSSASTYCSSVSIISSSCGPQGRGDELTSVLWNSSDRFGITLEPAVKDMGARIKSISSRSDVLGVESLSVGDVLVKINGVSIGTSAFSSITRFLKHSKGTCKLRFRSAVDATASKSSTTSNPATEQDNSRYCKVLNLLEETMKRVSAVEETLRPSSAMSLRT